MGQDVTLRLSSDVRISWSRFQITEGAGYPLKAQLMVAVTPMERSRSVGCMVNFGVPRRKCKKYTSIAAAHSSLALQDCIYRREGGRRKQRDIHPARKSLSLSYFKSFNSVFDLFKMN